MVRVNVEPIKAGNINHLRRDGHHCQTLVDSAINNGDPEKTISSETILNNYDDSSG